MGLDTRAYAKATDEWKEGWVERANAKGGRTVMYGLMWEPVGQRNYGLAGGYLRGRAPFTLEDAPALYQEGLEDLPWPGGQRNYGLLGGRIGPPYPLIGGMVSGNGDGPSFRGKAYTEYVERITGHSLYEPCDEPWDGELLESITERLEANVDGAPVDVYVKPAERRALAEWFRVCVDHDLAVSGDC
jgi:hypothetical protein